MSVPLPASETSYNPTRLIRELELQVRLAIVSGQTEDAETYFEALVELAAAVRVAELTLAETLWESDGEHKRWSDMYAQAKGLLAAYKARMTSMMPAQKAVIAVPLSGAIKQRLKAKQQQSIEYRGHIPVEDWSQIVEAYKSGMKSKDVAIYMENKYGSGAILLLLRSLGVPIRGRGADKGERK